MADAMATSRPGPQPIRVETSCCAVAKGKCKVQVDGILGPPGNRFELLRVQHHLDMKAYATHFINGVVRYAAEEGAVEQAERWMGKLDSRIGVVPSIEAFNALLRATTRKGDWDKADAWFEMHVTPALHPELGSLRPDGESYDILIQAAAEAGDLVRGERYMRLAWERGWKLAFRSYSTLMRALLHAGEPRRAHNLAEQLVTRGSSKVSDYEPATVKAELRVLRSLRTWSVDELAALFLELARGLADGGNPSCADRWLSYLVECGVKSSEHQDSWDYVRDRTPPEIQAASLHVERMVGFTNQPASPSARLPVVLSGEERADDGMIVERSLSSRRRSSCRKMGEVNTQLLSPGWKGAKSPAAAEGYADKPVTGRGFLASSPDSAASTRAPSTPGTAGQMGVRWASLAAPQTARNASPSPSSRSAGGRPSPRSTGRHASPRRGLLAASAPLPGLQRLLEAKRQMANADRAGAARRGPPPALG